MDKERDIEVEREERAIYLIVLAACAPILIALGIENRAIEGGNALMLILVALGLVGLLAGAIAMRRARVPHARAISSSSHADDNQPLPR